MYYRYGKCSKCGYIIKTKSNFETISELKFNLLLFKHYRHKHKINIIFKKIIYKSIRLLKNVLSNIKIKKS